MDVNSIGQLATGLSAVHSNQEVAVAVLKKALDGEAAVATQLLDALPPVNLPPHLGQNINTTA